MRKPKEEEVPPGTPGDKVPPLLLCARKYVAARHCSGKLCRQIWIGWLEVRVYVPSSRGHRFYARE